MKKPDFYIVEKYDDVAAFYYIDSDPPVVSVEATGADDSCSLTIPQVRKLIKFLTTVIEYTKEK